MINPDVLRLTCFVVILLLCAVWETRAPRKALTQNRWFRWTNNLGLVGLNGLTMALLSPIAAVEAALFASRSGFGLFNWYELPVPLVVIGCVVLLDLTIYFQHLVFHRVPILWRLHRMHHSDQDIDVTTGARFHPVEIWLSIWVKVAVVALLGAPVIAVVAFEIILNGSAMFNHSNAKLPLSMDKVLRKLIVTPDMHRVHHSVIVRETHSNFGFFLSIWDRIFSTYRAQPEKGHHEVEIGIDKFRLPDEQRLDKMLTQPFRQK